MNEQQRKLLEMRMANLRANREQCHHADRLRFDELIRQAQAELRGVGEGGEVEGVMVPSRAKSS